MGKKNSAEREKGKQVITFLPVRLRDQVAQLAKRDDISLSAVVRRAVRQFVAAQTG